MLRLHRTISSPSQPLAFARPQVLAPGQLQHAPPFFRLLMIDITAKARTSAIIITRMMSIGFIQKLLQAAPNKSVISRKTAVTPQATAHCHTITAMAHFPPISRLMEAIAATQGV